ncbi:hypothetical protein BDW02DRAFT_513434, partial [Decorospora gaudefroyi]
INTLTTRRYQIQFRDNLECTSIRDIKVKTLFSTILFAIMPINTLFLLYLVDIDKHKIYLNNVDNVLIYYSN